MEMEVGVIIDQIECLIQDDIGERGIGALIKANKKRQLFAAASHLIGCKRVAILSGFPCNLDLSPPTETDGVVGVLALVRALVSIGIQVDFLTDESNQQVFHACFLHFQTLFPSSKELLAWHTFPASDRWSKEHAEEVELILTTADHIIGIERPGRASDNKYYTMSGIDISELVAPLDVCFSAVLEKMKGHSKKIVSTCIGDGGNEMGMGNVHKTASVFVKKGQLIASTCCCDNLIICGISDWGGIALASTVKLLSAEACNIISPSDYVSFLNVAISAGACDGVSKTNTLHIDGFPILVSLNMTQSILNWVNYFAQANPVNSFSRLAGTAGELSLPVLGIGCWAFGGKENSYWGAQDTKISCNIVNRALEEGFNYFDTAEIYNDGLSEIQLGKSVKLANFERKNIIIGSKILPNHTYPPSMLFEHVSKSIQRLQVTYIDVYMVHWPFDSAKSCQNSVASVCGSGNLSSNADIVELDEKCIFAVFQTLKSLQKRGLIRHIGVSNFGVKQLKQALSAGVCIAVNQLPYSLLSRGIEFDIVPFCRKNSIGIIGYMPLLQGLLTDKYKSLHDLPMIRKRTRHFNSRNEGTRHGEQGFEPLVVETLGKIKKLCIDYKISMSQVALSWCISKTWMTSCLVGCRNEEQLNENILAVEQYRKYASSEMWKELDLITDPLKMAMGSSVDLYENECISRTK